MAERRFTFQYVSILIMTKKEIMEIKDDLHSNMFLF